MTTNLFISWSGPLSQRVAAVIHEWIPSVLQSVDPFLSSEDIDKGAWWSDHVASKLEECGFGVIVLTSSNLNAPWVMFESGALSKMVGRSNVAPVLVNVEVAQVRPPLSQFQATRLEEDDFLRLVRSINKVGDSTVREDVLEKTFRALWPQFQQDVREAIAATSEEQAEPVVDEKVDLNSLSLSIGDLIKSVQSMRDELRSGSGRGSQELLERTLMELRMDRHSSTDIAPGAVKDVEYIHHTLSEALEKSKAHRISLSREVSDDIVLRAKRASVHLRRKTQSW